MTRRFLSPDPTCEQCRGTGRSGPSIADEEHLCPCVEAVEFAKGETMENHAKEPPRCDTCRHWQSQSKTWGTCPNIIKMIGFKIHIPPRSTGLPVVEFVETPFDFGCVLHEETER